jgi:acyl transferase domain-containing protein
LAQAASGIMALIKCCLMMYRREWLPSVLLGELHFQETFSAANIALQEMQAPFAPGTDPIMAINAFGFGGTNTHTILRAYAGNTESRLHLAAERTSSHSSDATVSATLLLSAESQSALTQLKQRFLQYLEHNSVQASDPLDWLALCAAVARRTQLTFRFALVAATAQEAVDILQQSLQAPATLSVMSKVSGLGFSSHFF